MITGPLLKRYAKALADTTLESGVQTIVAEDLSGLADLVKGSPELTSILKNPTLPNNEKLALLERIWESVTQRRFHEQTRRLLELLLQNRRIHLLVPLQHAYQQIVDQREGIVSATIKSCKKLSKEHEHQVEKGLQTLTGARIRAQYLTDESLIGGLVVQIGSTVYDGSISNQLATIRKSLIQGSL